MYPSDQTNSTAVYFDVDVAGAFSAENVQTFNAPGLAVDSHTNEPDVR